jgi:hypothetical protein
MRSAGDETGTVLFGGSDADSVVQRRKLIFADADVYNVTMSGHGFGFAVNSGRMAGENAAKSLIGA